MKIVGQRSSQPFWSALALRHARPNGGATTLTARIWGTSESTAAAPPECCVTSRGDVLSDAQREGTNVRAARCARNRLHLNAARGQGLYCARETTDPI